MSPTVASIGAKGTVEPGQSSLATAISRTFTFDILTYNGTTYLPLEILMVY
jgi:hypothetical protein